jgi:hypothetical protein
MSVLVSIQAVLVSGRLRRLRAMLRRLRATLRWLWAVKLKVIATLACAEISAGAGLRLTNIKL